MATRHFVPREYPFAFTNGVQASWRRSTPIPLHQAAQALGGRGLRTIINPQLVDEQIRGGVVQGLGAGCSKNASMMSAAS